MAVVKKESGGFKVEKTEKKLKRMKGDDDEPFKLPTEVTEPLSDLGGYTWLIFGDKKIGKTSLTAQMKKALHLMTEPGGKALRLFSVPISNWRVFKKAVRAVRKTTKYETVVIDIADPLYGMSDDYICEKLVIPDLSSEDWGKGWREQRKEFEREIMGLLNSGKGVVFISHATEQEIETRDGKKYDRIMPTMHKRMRELIEGIVDVWAYYTYAGKRRVLYVLGDDHISAGHRLDGRFRTPDNRSIRRIDMGTSPEQGYQNIVDAFNNKFVPPKESDVDDQEQEETEIKKTKFKVSRR